MADVNDQETNVTVGWPDLAEVNDTGLSLVLCEIMGSDRCRKDVRHRRGTNAR